MKIQRTHRLLFSLVLSGISFTAIGLSFDASPKGATQAHGPTQLDYGHAPAPTQATTQAHRQT